MSGFFRRVAYTTDSKFLLCCSGCVIKVFSTATGAQVRLLKGHKDEVTAVAHNPASVLQAISASLDGCVVLWDLDDAIVLRVVCVGVPIIAMASLIDTERAFVLTGTGTRPDAPAYCHGLAGNSRVYSVALRVGEEQTAWATSQLAKAGTAQGEGHGFGSFERPWPAHLVQIVKAKGATAMVAARCGGESVVVGALCGKLLRLHDMSTGATIDVTQRRSMSCLAISPAARLAAAGDEQGRICLYRIDGAEGGGPPRASEMHWHAQRVGALAFSPEGAYLYSVGKEGVLVSWQLASSHRTFLPRLGAPLFDLSCSPDGTAAAALGSDNAVRLVDLGANSVRRHVCGMLVGARLEPDARSGSMVVHGGGAAGKLQWWSPLLDAQQDSLEVAPRNVSGSLPAIGGGVDDNERRKALRQAAAGGGASLVQVALASLSSDGSALATLESRSEAELQQHAALKVWVRADGEWHLSARILQPHQGTVHGLAFHPDLLLVASAGADAKFKLWEARAADAQGEPGGAPKPYAANGVETRWACRSVGYYRQSAATATAFSGDGTLLGVAYAPDVVTLWRPLTNEMVYSVCHPLASAQDELSWIGFSGEGAALLAHSSHALICWHLLSGSLAWSHAASRVVAAATDRSSDTMIVAVSVVSSSTEGAAAEGEDAPPPLSHAILEFHANAVVTHAAPEATQHGAQNGGHVAEGAGGVPSRVWQLGGHSAPRSVGFLPAPGKGGGAPLVLTAAGEMHLLDPEAVPKPAGGRGALEAVNELSRLAGGGGALTAVFNESATSDALTQLALPSTAALELRPPAARSGSAKGRYAAGWEAKAIDRWLTEQLSTVPSHLLPPIGVIYHHVVQQALRPATHLGDGSQASELRVAARQLASENGTSESLQATVEELTPMLQRRFSLAAAADRSQRKLHEIATRAATAASAGDTDEPQSGKRRKGGKKARLTDLQMGGADAEDAEDEDGLEANVLEGGELAGAGTRLMAVEDGPPAGWMPLPSLGPHVSGGHVADLEGVPPRRWAMPLPKQGDAPPPSYARDGRPDLAGLSTADARFWRQEAYQLDELAKLAAAIVADSHDTPHTEDTEEAHEEGSPAYLGSWVDVASVPPFDCELPGAKHGDSLAAEMRAAEAAFEGYALEADPVGVGLLPVTVGSAAARVALGVQAIGGGTPRPIEWQEAPTKGEWLTLAKVYAQRRRDGEAVEELAALAEAVRASGSGAANKVLDKVDRA